MSSEAALSLLFTALALPPLALVILGLSWFMGWKVSERVTRVLAVGATGLSALLTAVGGAVALVQHRLPLTSLPWTYFEVGNYRFELIFQWDAVSLSMALACSLISSLVVSFSTRYLHREEGHFRYFILMLIFASAMQWLVVAGSYDQLFLGWELVGLTSILLVAFFNDRTQPVLAAIRVMATYRICDVGLLLASVLMHHAAHGTTFAQLNAASLPAAQATPIALLLLLAASGKAAQLPFGGWLPRAMEGPTSSSALFYGALSVHAGIYLLIRSEPLFEASTVASVAAVTVGGITAISGAAMSRVQSDAKSSLAWASMSQLGLMVVEVGLHLPTVALLHLFGHASLRGFQLLKAPSLLHDTLQLRKDLGRSTLALNVKTLPAPLYRFLREGLFLEVLFEAWLVRPLLALGRRFERIDSTAPKPSNPSNPSLPSSEAL